MSFTKDEGKKKSFTGKGSLTKSDGKGSLSSERGSKKNVSFTEGGKGSIGSDGKSSVSSDGKSRKKKKKKTGELESGKSEDDDDNLIDSGIQSSNQDEVDSDYDSDEESMADQSKHVLKTVKKAADQAATAFIKTFVHYGPPYNGKPFSHELITELCKPMANLRTIHKILNKKTNPNHPDPGDLYYTPVHWAARNLHMIAMRMLIRAGAKINVTDEMGVTPLDLAVMMKRNDDMRKRQIKMVKYLLDERALVNTRDKGGNGPIDHAAVNQDLEICEILLEAGASLIRDDNELLVVHRKPILEKVYKPDVYKLLYEALQKELIDRNEERHRRKLLQDDLDQQKHFDSLLGNLDKKKGRRKEKERAAALNEKKRLLMTEWKERLNADHEQLLQMKVDNGIKNGVWKRNVEGYWNLKGRTADTSKGAGLYEDSKKLMHSLAKQNHIDNYNSKWTEITGGGVLEVPWKRSDPFKDMEDSVDKLSGVEQSTPNKLVSGGIDLNFRDENDAMLEDAEDLDSLLEELNS